MINMLTKKEVKKHQKELIEFCKKGENNEFQDTLSSSEYEKIFYEINKQDKEFIKRRDEIILQEINKTDGSVDFDLNNLYDRINIRERKLAGEKLK